MKMKKIKYKIDWSYSVLGYQEVEGYAIDSGHPDIRICVRQLSRGHWKADHFDTGYSVEYLGSTNRYEAASSALNTMRAKVASGEYRKKMIEHGFWQRLG